MENGRIKAKGDMIYPEDTRKPAGSGKIVLFTSLVFLVITGALVLSMMRYYQVRFADNARYRIQGYYTPDMIETILVEAVPDGQARGTTVAYQVGRSYFLGESLHQAPNLAQVYYTIQEYQPARKGLGYQVQDLYTKYLGKANHARKTGQYRQALYYFKQARLIRPGSWYVRRSIAEVREILNAIYQKENLNFVRSYDKVKAIARSQLGYIRYLYNRERAVYPGLTGVVAIELHVRPDGSVNNLKVVRSTLGNERFQKLLLKNLKLWQFREVDKKEKDLCLLVRYTFNGKDDISLYTGEACSGEEI